MAKCPFARWDQINGAVGPYSGGPYKIVHHTTEISTYGATRAAYARNKSEPHFTVVGSELYQHIDTGRAARSLKNLPGGIQTNRDSAVQIEVVGFTGRPKDVTTLETVARLCRWIESKHQVAQEWPNGQPRWSTNGRDPGGHNRNAENWDSQGGHYGHSQVPENTHWDPGYTPAEVAVVTPDAVFDPHEELAASVVTEGLGRESANLDNLRVAEDTLQRMLARLPADLPVPLRRGLSRVTLRVALANVRLAITLEGSFTRTDDIEPRPRSRSRATKRNRRNVV